MIFLVALFPQPVTDELMFELKFRKLSIHVHVAFHSAADYTGDPRRKLAPRKKVDMGFYTDRVAQNLIRYIYSNTQLSNTDLFSSVYTVVKRKSLTFSTVVTIPSAVQNENTSINNAETKSLNFYSADYSSTVCRQAKCSLQIDPQPL